MTFIVWVQVAHLGTFATQAAAAARFNEAAEFKSEFDKHPHSWTHEFLTTSAPQQFMDLPAQQCMHMHACMAMAYCMQNYSVTVTQQLNTWH